MTFEDSPVAGSKPIRVVIADDHRMARVGLILLLRLEPDIEVVGEADDGYEAIRLATELRPDVLIADVSMPGPGGVEIAQHLRPAFPACRVVVLTMHEDTNLMRQALDAGAMGYLVKRAAESELVNAVRMAACGQVYVDVGLRAAALAAEAAASFPADAAGHASAAPGDLHSLSPAELRLLQLLAQGFVMSQVSQMLGQDAKTTEQMRKELLARLGLRGRVDVMRFVSERGLLAE